MQIPQRSVVPCSGLTSWVYGANHAGITAVVPMGGRHPQRAASSAWLSDTSKTCSISVVTDGKLFCSFVLTEELPAANSITAIFPHTTPSVPGGRKWISKRDYRIFYQKDNILLQHHDFLMEFGILFLPSWLLEIHFPSRLWEIPFHTLCRVCF